MSGAADGAAAAARTGISVQNTAECLQLLKALSVSFFVTAQQLDILTELFDDCKDKVRPLALRRTDLPTEHQVLYNLIISGAMVKPQSIVEEWFAKQ